MDVDSQDEEESDGEESGGESDDSRTGGRGRGGAAGDGFTLLAGVTRARGQKGKEKEAPPVVVRCEDGFEKRWLVRCGRCRLVVGFELGWEQFEKGTGGATGDEEGRREDVVYVLPGAMVSTEDMRTGKMPQGVEVDFGGVGKVAAAAAAGG